MLKLLSRTPGKCSGEAAGGLAELGCLPFLILLVICDLFTKPFDRGVSDIRQKHKKP